VSDLYKRWFRPALDVKGSPAPHEKASVAVGRNEDNGSPSFVPIQLLQKSRHIEGPSGSGKSAGILGLLEQLAHRQSFSIVCIDLKGDTNELNAALSLPPSPQKQKESRSD
jgi:hypothetical protein